MLVSVPVFLVTSQHDTVYADHVRGSGFVLSDESELEGVVAGGKVQGAELDLLRSNDVSRDHTSFTVVRVEG